MSASAASAWWNFDNETGQDATGTGHTGTLHGNPQFEADTSAPVAAIETAVEVIFPTLLPSTTYRLQATDSLTMPNWQDVGEAFSGLHGQAGILRSIRGQTRMYYRVIQQ